MISLVNIVLMLLEWKGSAMSAGRLNTKKSSVQNCNIIQYKQVWLMSEKNNSHQPKCKHQRQRCNCWVGSKTLLYLRSQNLFKVIDVLDVRRFLFPRVSIPSQWHFATVNDGETERRRGNRSINTEQKFCKTILQIFTAKHYILWHETNLKTLTYRAIHLDLELTMWNLQVYMTAG